MSMIFDININNDELLIIMREHNKNEKSSLVVSSNCGAQIIIVLYTSMVELLLYSPNFQNFQSINLKKIQAKIFELKKWVVKIESL
jgi:hypothetical protein